MTNEELTDRDEGNKAALTQAASTVGGGGVLGRGGGDKSRVCPHTTHSL